MHDAWDSSQPHQTGLTITNEEARTGSIAQGGLMALARVHHSLQLQATQSLLHAHMQGLLQALDSLLCCSLCFTQHWPGLNGSPRPNDGRLCQQAAKAFPMVLSQRNTNASGHSKAMGPAAQVSVPQR